MGLFSEISWASLNTQKESTPLLQEESVKDQINSFAIDKRQNNFVFSRFLKLNSVTTDPLKLKSN